MPDFYICAGVRRSLAARELGRHDITARITEPGLPDRLARLPLASLHSPKLSVPRDWRYLRVLRAAIKLTDLDPIDVQPLGLVGQSASVQLASVVLT
jgi:hypothetical protein